MKIIQYARCWYERAMTEPQVNSRMIYLIHGLAVAMCTVALVTAFIIVQNKASYPEMLLALSGGGAAAAAGRMMSKLGDKKKAEESGDTSDDVPKKG